MIVIFMHQKIILLWSLGTQDNCFSLLQQRLEPIEKRVAEEHVFYREH